MRFPPWGGKGGMKRRNRLNGSPGSGAKRRQERHQVGRAKLRLPRPERSAPGAAQLCRVGGRSGGQAQQGGYFCGALLGLAAPLVDEARGGQAGRRGPAEGAEAPKARRKEGRGIATGPLCHVDTGGL